MPDARFALRSFTGKPVAYYAVSTETLEAAKPTEVKTPAHHIAIVDRSGSMYYDLGNLKEMLEKVMTLDEYRQSELRYSLISYSSHGDVTLHFCHVPVADVMNPSNPYLERIRSIRVTGLTCISQAVQMALDEVRDEEMTCISLHSDGYANDRSPSSEYREIDRLVALLAKKPNVFMNTIAYRDWCDFKLLSAMANSLSGTCLQAYNIKQVYDAMYDTSALLAGQVSPALEVPLSGNATYQVFYSSGNRKVVGSSGDLLVRGLGSDDDRTVYRYREISEMEFKTRSEPECHRDGDIKPVLAFARAQLAEGNVNRAKYALVSTQNMTLLDRHAKALISTDIAAFSGDLDKALFDEVGENHQYATGDNYGMDTSQASVLSVLSILNEYSRDLRLNLDELHTVYTKRSVKRVPGIRGEDGKVVPPTLDTRTTDTPPWVKVSAVEVNRNTATANIRIVRPIELIKRGTDEVIKEVAGIVLDLSDFRNYTVISDGALNVPYLVFKISNRKAHAALVEIGALPNEPFDHKAEYTVKFEGRPLVAYDQTFQAPDGVFDKIAKLKIMQSILSALLKDEAADLTRDQIDELKAHYLSPAMYVNFPTTTEYADLQEALSTGQVDTKLSFKVDVGTPAILNAGKMKSANAFLDRMFTVTIDGEKQKKPKWPLWWNEKAVVDYKTLSARTKIDAIDDLMKPIYEDFLGLSSNESVEGILALAGVGDEDTTAFLTAINPSGGRGEETVEALTTVKKAIDRALDKVYQEEVIPLAFYVGATGLVPDEFGAKAMTADDLKAKYPAIKVAKAELDGSFFEVGESIITVFVKGEYFSTGKKPAA